MRRRSRPRPRRSVHAPAATTAAAVKSVVSTVVKARPAATSRIAITPRRDGRAISSSTIHGATMPIWRPGWASHSPGFCPPMITMLSHGKIAGVEAMTRPTASRPASILRRHAKV